jgi:hypothetical protein
MHSVKPTTIVLPDGVERELRSTLGARKRIIDRFGMSMKDVLDKYDSGAFPEVLYAMMHDADGNPPTVSVKWMEENLPESAGPEILAAIISAMSQGAKPKNEIESLVNEAMMNQAWLQAKGMNGSNSSPSEPSDSASVELNSGGDTLSVKSTPE